MYLLLLVLVVMLVKAYTDLDVITIVGTRDTAC